MAENADYLIANIVDVAKEVDFTQSVIDFGLIWGLICLALAAATFLILLFVAEKCWWCINKLWVIVMMIVLSLVGITLLIAYALSCYEMPFLTSQLDGLVTAYESLYGPLPGGVI